MTITEVIRKLEEIESVHGDLPVHVENGLDPSDLDEAMFVGIRMWGYSLSDEDKKKVVAIES